MAEKDKIFSTTTKYVGIFNLSNLYKFCYDWLSEETDLIVAEKKYTEKLKGTDKDVEIEWEGTRKVNDYFKRQVDVKFTIKGLKKVDVNKGGKTVSTNEGEVKMEVKGILVRDYDSKFEVSPFYKFLRATYDKWIIPSTVEALKDKLAEDCVEFLEQTKAYLDLEGKK
jgi:hypothetical protein